MRSDCVRGDTLTLLIDGQTRSTPHAPLARRR